MGIRYDGARLRKLAVAAFVTCSFIFPKAGMAQEMGYTFYIEEYWGYTLGGADSACSTASKAHGYDYYKLDRSGVGRASVSTCYGVIPVYGS